MTRHLLCIAFLCLSSAPALAELKGRDIWGALKANLEASGTVSATQKDIDGGFEVSDIRRNFVRGARQEINGPLKFLNRADGSVSIVMPDRLDVTFVTAEQVKTFTSVAPDDLSITASGTPDNIQLQFAGRSVNFAQGAGPNLDSGIYIHTAELSQLAGSFNLNNAEPRVVQLELTAGLLDATRLIQPRGAQTTTYRSTMTDIDLSVNGRVPSEAINEAMGPILSNPNTTLTATLKHGLAADFDSMLGRTGKPKGLSEFQRGFHLVQISKGRANLSVSLTNGSGTLNWNGFNLANSDTSAIGIGRMRLGANIALIDRGGRTTNSISARLSGLTLPDNVWATLDPTGVFSKDAGHLEFDLDAKGGLSLAKLMFLPPKSRQFVFKENISTVDLKKLVVSALGAHLRANGAFTLNHGSAANAASRNFKGSTDVKVEGGIALISAFEAMGKLQAAQAGALRGIANQFAKRDGSKDLFTSRIEWTENGEIVANGRVLPIRR